MWCAEIYSLCAEIYSLCVETYVLRGNIFKFFGLCVEIIMSHVRILGYLHCSNIGGASEKIM